MQKRERLVPRSWPFEWTLDSSLKRCPQVVIKRYRESYQFGPPFCLELVSRNRTCWKLHGNENRLPKQLIDFHLCEDNLPLLRAALSILPTARHVVPGVIQDRTLSTGTLGCQRVVQGLSKIFKNHVENACAFEQLLSMIKPRKTKYNS